MEEFVKGDVLVVPFPFSDLSGAKRRPVLLIAALGGEGIILCQITSRNRTDRYSVKIADRDFESGGLKIESFIRPDRIFTADKSLILYKAGRIKPEKISEVEDKLVKIITKHS